MIEHAADVASQLTEEKPEMADYIIDLAIADDGRVWLVDWEYAGMGHPLFDLACVSANCAFSCRTAASSKGNRVRGLTFLFAV